MNIALTTQETLGLMKDSLAKNVTIQTGLTAYDLQAPAKNLYPTITPLRNSIPRVARLNPGDAAHWRSIFGTTGSGFDAMGWVPEGQRSASMSYSAIAVTLPYVTLGEEDTVTFEAEAAAQGFEDINATATLRILQKTMRKEETALLGGNFSLPLGKPGTPTLSASGTGSAHEILPVKGDVLAFVAGDGQHFARRIEHPGSVIPERSYLRSSLEDMKDEILSALAGTAAETWESA
jgi:hypothetical protein